MTQDFQPGDFLVFQLESGFALLRVLEVDDNDGQAVWHIAVYADLFMDIETADAAVAGGQRLSVSHPHLALTNRAFESTQVSRLGHVDLTGDELQSVQQWRALGDGEISDRSVRLHLGLR